MTSLSLAQRWALALIRSVSGFVSVAASSTIIYQVALRYREDQRALRLHARNTSSPRLVTPYHRLLLGLSLLDVLYSFWAGLSTIPVPASSGAIYGFGTTATCSMQGFFTQFVAANPIYMASLSVYFMLKIRYNISDDFFHRKLEVWFHLIPWAFAIGTGSMGVGLKIFNPMSIPEMGCWLGSYPANCLWTDAPCTRGYKFEELVDFYAIFFAHAWIFVSFLIVLASNILIYCAIRAQERRNEGYFASSLQRSALHINPMSVASSRTIKTQPHEEEEKQISPMQDETEGSSYEDNVQHSRPVEKNPSSTTASSTAIAITQVGKDVSGRTNVLASRVALVQSTLYVSTSFFTAIWIFLPYLGLKTGLVNIHWRYFFAFMVNGLVPLQGLFNLIIFVRLPYVRRRNTEKEWSRFRCIIACLFYPDIKDPCVTKRRRATLQLIQVNENGSR
jgi:hypothetical protein